MPAVGELHGHTRQVRSLGFSKDGRQLFSAGNDGTVRIWDLLTCQQLRCIEGCVKPEPDHSSRQNIAFSPDGVHALTHGEGTAIHLWDIAATKEPTSLYVGHAGSVYGCAWSVDGNRFLSTSSTGSGCTAILWDLKEEKEVWQFEGKNGIVAALSPDGRRALTGSSATEHVIRYWDVEKGKELHRLEGHTSALPPRGLTFSRDGRSAVSAGYNDGTIRVWDLEAGKEVKRYQQLSLKHVNLKAVTFTPDGVHVISANPCRLWEPETGLELYRWPSHPHVFAISPEGTKLVTGETKLIRVWDMPRPDEASLATTIPRIPDDFFATRVNRLKEGLPRLGKTKPGKASPADKAHIIAWVERVIAANPQHSKDFLGQIITDLQVYPLWEAALLWVKYIPVPATPTLPFPKNQQLSLALLDAGELAYETLGG